MNVDHRSVIRGCRERVGTWLVVVATGAALLVVTTSPVAAAGPYNVTFAGDAVDANPGNGLCATAAGQCTLRAAIQEANATPALDVVVLQADVAYNLTIAGDDAAAATGDLDITQPVTIEGKGATVTQGAGTERVFEIRGGTATIRELEIAGGKPATNGGGIAVTSGTLALERSTVRGNTAPSGAGIHLEAGTTGTITASTVSGNTAGGGITSKGTLTVAGSTIANNAGAPGVQAASGVTTLRGSIIASPVSPATNCSAPAGGGTITSGGHNLASDGSCSLSAAGDKPSTPANFVLTGAGAPNLAANGGPTPTHRLADSSAAIDAVPFGTAGCADGLDDQLTNPRAHQPGAPCDIGAFERQPPVYADETTDTVDQTPGDGRCADAANRCSLRAAVQETNALTTNDVIHLRSSGDYRLTLTGIEEAAATGDLDLRDNLTIEGHGAIVNAQMFHDRVFEVRNPGQPVAVTIRQLDVTGGNPDPGTANPHGGGISVSTTASQLNLDRVTVAGNSAGNLGGGVFYSSGGTGTISHSTISGNTAAVMGGGVHANGSPLVVRWSTITQNTAPTGGGIATNNTAATVRLTGTIVADQAGGANCAQPQGDIISSGHNLASDTTCDLGTAGDRPIGSANLAVLADDGGPTRTHRPNLGSPAIDGSGNPFFGAPCGTTTDRTDQMGGYRPEKPSGNCDIGAVEVDQSIANRKSWTLLNHRIEPSPGVDRNPTEDEPRLVRAFAAYLTGDPATGDADVGWLAGTADGHEPFPQLDGSSIEWEGEFVSPLLFRMYVNLPATRNTMSPAAQGQISTMIGKYVNADVSNTAGGVQRVCRFAWEWDREQVNGVDTYDGVTNPWTQGGTENHSMIRRVNCLLGLFALQTDAVPGNDPLVAETGTWQQWAEMLGQWLDQSAQSGLFAEIQAPEYSSFTLSALYNLRDFPLKKVQGPDLAGTDLNKANELRSLTDDYLDLFWHDVALNFNPATGVASGPAARTYPWNPDGRLPNAQSRRGSPVTDPRWNYFFQWLYVYDWHDFPTTPTSATSPQILAAASSDYTPLPISGQVASTTTAYEYASMRPQRDGVTADQAHNIRRDVSGNADFVMGATTYDPRFEHRMAVENITYTVAANNDPEDRIVISGIAAEKPGGGGSLGDYFAINGTAFRDVIVAGRDSKAGDPPTTQTCIDAEPAGGWDGPPQYWADTTCDGNSRGMRVFLGRGELRNNLEIPGTPGGWYFTRAGNTYAAIRIPSDAVDLLDEYGAVVAPGSARRNVVELRLDSKLGAGADIWTPLVVQMGRKADYTSFDDFKSKVAACNFSYANGVLTYTSLRKITFQMDRQQAWNNRAQPNPGTIPRVSSTTAPTCQSPVTANPRSTRPTYVYSSPATQAVNFLEMGWPANGVPATIATLKGPDGTAQDLDLAWNP